MAHDLKNTGAPVKDSERFIILDALRGFALFGICMANFPEFSLYSFLSSEDAQVLSTSAIDFFTKYFLYIFIDGKFYTIFSLLFGIGFSIIIANAEKRETNGFLIFYRRMFYLILIGFAHLMLIWSGDILMLYAIVGMTLPLFRNSSNKTILSWASFFLIFPVIIDTFCQIFNLHPSGWIVDWQWQYCDKYGITEANFAYWLRDATTYDDVFKFLIQGAIVRLQEFVDGNRYFKVLGLFLIGYYIGRNRFYARLSEYRSLLKQIAIFGLTIGLPLSGCYAWSCMEGHPLGLGFHSFLYFVSVYLTGFGYVAAFCLLYLKYSDALAWKIFSYPGKMALTNYIGQSALGMLIFYGIGFGLGAATGLIFVEFIVAGVFIFEILFSACWLTTFRFGPLEWVWRCLTYNRLFPILKH